MEFRHRGPGEQEWENRCPGPGKQDWPEVVGACGEAAAAKIERENPEVHAIVLLEGSPTTKDFRCNRVWVWVNKHGIVIREPHVG